MIVPIGAIKYIIFILKNTICFSQSAFNSNFKHCNQLSDDDLFNIIVNKKYEFMQFLKLDIYLTTEKQTLRYHYNL